jgi:ketosteroid isomerase-like protein
VRSRSVLVLAAVTLAACHTSQPGSSFTAASLLEPPSDAEAAHDELLHADIARADSVSRHGFAGGLTSVFARDVIYLRGGLPIVRGRGAVQVILAADSIGAGTGVRWQPVRAEASADRRSGFTYGYAIYGAPQAGAVALRVDRYIAFWRKVGEGWAISAYAETYGSPPKVLALPSEVADSVLADVPMSRGTGALEAIRSADSDFSDDASRLGTGEAFGRYAAGDAQIFSAPGEFITGPAAITQSFGAQVQGNALVWHPVHGEVAGSGDLGFTVGNAVFTGQRENGAPIVGYSKYLTVWKRQRDGHWRYVVDGGSARPGR